MCNKPQGEKQQREGGREEWREGGLIRPSLSPSPRMSMLYILQDFFHHIDKSISKIVSSVESSGFRPEAPWTSATP